MGDRARRALPVMVSALLFVAALEVLRRELHAVTWADLSADLVTLPLSRLAFALGLTAVNYALLTGYDFLAFESIGKTLPRARIAGAALLAYAVSNSIGLAAISGASVRYRFYSRWGVTWEELARLAFSYSVTFWLGLLALGGASLTMTSLPAAHGLPAPGAVHAVGWLLLAAVAAFLIASASSRAPLRVAGLSLAWPPFSLAVRQLALSITEWLCAGAVLFVLLPSGAPGFLTFLAAFLASILIGQASHVPGGVGVFEGLMVVLLAPYLASGALLPALVSYRVVYYIVPFAMAVVVLVGDELRLRRAQAARASALLGRIAELVTPRLLAAVTFLAGMILLFSGATPAAPGRLSRLTEIIPLPLIEASHFTGSVAGALLLVISRGLARRLDAAYYAAAAIIGVGIVASLLKGLDYEEAGALLLVLVLLWRARPAFDRSAAFFESRFSPSWVAALLGAVSASLWLGIFAFKHVGYSSELWWQVEEHAELSRFLRAALGTAMVVLVFGVARLLRPAPHDVDAPSDEDLAQAASIIATQPSTSPNLVFLRDKGVLFNPARTAFLMYAVQGRTWVAMGDPVGPSSAVAELVRMFLERCDDFAATPVFYEVSRQMLHHYADFGLTFVKLGEEARVDLHAFTIAGAGGARFRQAIRRLEKDGGQFRVVPVDETPALLPELRRVSDDWLQAKAGAEKGFSLGFFDERYLVRFPVAVVERGGRIVAFANLWPGAGHEEMSIDLMRYHADAPKGVMEALLSHVLQWSKEAGYHWFALGMAPLSGFEHSPVAPLWNRLGALLYEHGEKVYNFQGLRAYKEKFSPQWESHYMACPGGLGLPRVLADVSALVAGGYRRIFLK